MQVVITMPLQGQVRNYTLSDNNVILKDSIWLKNNHWKAANLFHSGNKIDSLSAYKIEFKAIPVYKFVKGLKKFNYSMNFPDLINLDTTRVSGFIVRDSLIIGYLSGFQLKGKWFILPLQIFTLEEPLLEAIDHRKLKTSNGLFEFYPFGLGSICYNLNDKTYIFDDHLNKFVFINDYIENRISLDNLIKYYLESDTDRSNVIR